MIVYSIKSLIRDSFAGEIIYRLSKGRLCKSEYEEPEYVIPEKYFIDSSSSDLGTDEKSLNIQVACKDPIIVTFDTPEDLNNPHNWPLLKKFIVSAVTSLSTASLYMGGPLYTPAESQLLEAFNTTHVRAVLGLSLFVWGYGFASLWFSPMSENPSFGGRMYIYISAQLLFCCLQIPCALVNHLSSFSVLRLLSGIMAAPPLSTGGATFNDIFEFPAVVYALIAWSVGGIMGPCMGPLIGGALVQHNSWRWAFWYLLIQASAVLLIMCFFFPETSAQAILMKKARILRKLTGNHRIMAPGDIVRQNQKVMEILKHVFWHPIKLTLHEPVLMLINLHLGLTYSVMYLYYEAVPLAYGRIYNFNLVEEGLSYLSILVGCITTAMFYIPYLRKTLIKPLVADLKPDTYKVFGNAAIVSAIMAPAGMLLFGWSAHKGVHWIVSMIGNGMFGGALWLMFQTYLSFLADMYPPSQVASVFASNNVARCVLAAAFPLFATNMYERTSTPTWPVGWGCSLLAFISLPLIGLPVYMRNEGEKLHIRAIEKYGSL